MIKYLHILLDPGLRPGLMQIRIRDIVPIVAICYVTIQISFVHALMFNPVPKPEHPYSGSYKIDLWLLQVGVTLSNLMWPISREGFII